MPDAVIRLESPKTEPRDDRLPPLVFQIVRSLANDIIEGRYKPGDPIREQEIADRLNVSRAPVREAFRLLAMDGMVEMLPWRGVRVVVLTQHEIVAVYELTAALMGVAARLAATHASAEQIAAFNDHVSHMSRQFTNPKTMKEGLSMAFRSGRMLARMCGSGRVHDLLIKQEWLTYWRYHSLLSLPTKFWNASVVEWRALGMALKKRRPAEADRIARDITYRAVELLMGRDRSDAPKPARAKARAKAQIKTRAKAKPSRKPHKHAIG